MPIIGGSGRESAVWPQHDIRGCGNRAGRGRTGWNRVPVSARDCYLNPSSPGVFRCWQYRLGLANDVAEGVAGTVQVVKLWLAAHHVRGCAIGGRKGVPNEHAIIWGIRHYQAAVHDWGENAFRKSQR